MAANHDRISILCCDPNVPYRGDAGVYSFAHSTTVFCAHDTSGDVTTHPSQDRYKKNEIVHDRKGGKSVRRVVNGSGDRDIGLARRGGIFADGKVNLST